MEWMLLLCIIATCIVVEMAMRWHWILGGFTLLCALLFWGAVILRAIETLVR